MVNVSRDQVESLAARVREAVPASVDVSAAADSWRDLVTVQLGPRERFRTRQRRQMIVSACSAIADAPAGLMVRVEWR